MFKKRSIATQFALVFLVTLSLLGTALYFTFSEIYINQLKTQAETVADSVDAFGNWVAQYGRVWVKDNDQSYLGHMGPLMLPAEALAPASGVTAPSAVNFYSKNPALAQREFSEVVAKSNSPAKFHMTSHNVMNPNNKPDAFEEKALGIARNGGSKEYYEVLPGSFRYARTLYDQASCIVCHGNPENAPDDVKARYGVEHGFNFKEGDVAGIISVIIPTKPFLQVILNVISIWDIVLLAGVFIIPFVFMQVGVVQRIKHLSAVMSAISLGKKAEFNKDELTPDSANELHQLAACTDRLAASVTMAAAALRGQKKDS
ncbi:MAG TPA: DUF3365 domain-containing protein [Gallionella sp.]|nr:DUF3365 domain-containing protein [Gallionella sp.]